MACRHFFGRLETIPPLLPDDCYTQKLLCLLPPNVSPRIHSWLAKGEDGQEGKGEERGRKMGGRRKMGRVGKGNSSILELLFPHFEPCIII